MNTLADLCLDEIRCMAWLARCELLTNHRDIYQVGIFEWNNNLKEIRKKINNCISH